MRSFEDLVAWQKSHALTLHVYKLTRSWPSSERFALISQAQRAAVSIPANLAEGAAKRGVGEFRRYLDIAIGSRSELKYLLRLATELGYVNAADAPVVQDECEEVGRLLGGLSRSLKASS